MTQEIRTEDKLFSLCLLCDVVGLEANGHRDNYETVAQSLTSLRKNGLEITDEAFQRMAEGNTLFELDFYPENAEGGLTLIGDDLDVILTQAINIARPWALDADELEATADEKYLTAVVGQNATENFLRVVELSKCGVGFSINEHRTCNISDGKSPMRQQTAKDALEIMSHSDDDMVKELEEGKHDVMIEEDTIVRAYAYTDTPVGSYDTMHLNIRPCLVQMRAIVEHAAKCRDGGIYTGGLNVHTDRIEAELANQAGQKKT